MTKQKQYFELSLESLRVLAAWAAGCAERALPIYEELYGDDTRPREAISGVRVFAEGGKRVAKLRALALDAFRASHATQDPAAAAAARAASLAAASAYTHPFADVKQAQHIIGPAAYAALAIELKNGSSPQSGNDEVRWAVSRVQKEVCELLHKMPRQPEGKNRIDELLYDLDVGVRQKHGELKA